MNLIFKYLLFITYLTQVFCTKSPSHVHQLTDENFNQLTQGKNKGTWLIKLYADNCSACRQFGPTYELLAQEIAETTNSIQLGEIDVDNNNGLCLQFFITRVPSLYLIHDNKAYNVTDIPLKLQPLKEYLLNKQFLNQQPISGFFNPFGLFGLGLGFIGGLGTHITKLSKVAPAWVILSIPSFLIFIGFYFIFKPPTTDRRPITQPAPTRVSKKLK